MNKELKDKFPSWVNNDQQGEFTLCLGDDLDSLLSCSLLTSLKGYPVNHFYDFTALHTANLDDSRQAVGVDIAILDRNFKTWCNHVTLLYKDDKPNPLSANVNNIMGINCETNYKQKYAMSTALLICAYYGFLPTTEQGKMLLLAIDTAYKGHYNNNFTAVHTEWLKILHLEPLLEVLERHTEQQFRALEQEYQLYKHIVIEDRQLATELDLKAISKILGIKLELPTATFTKVKDYKRYILDIDQYKHLYARAINPKEPFTLAATSKRQICFSI